jgi:type II secretory pathway pseudopilin PulG
MKTAYRHKRSESGLTPQGPGRGKSQAGDTLLEVLIAITIIAISVVALVGVITTSVTSSAEYRSLATVDTVLKNFSDAVKYDLELQPQQPPAPTHYVNCATTSTYQIVSEYPTNAVVNAGVTIFGTGFVNINASSVWVATLSSPSTTPIVINRFVNGLPTITGGSNVSATVILASNQPGGYIQPGIYSVTLSDSTGDVVTSGTMLTVSPSATVLNPASGVVGTSVTASASGFDQNAPLTVQVDGTPATITSANTMTDANGNAVVTFNVPSVPVGEQVGQQNVVLSDGPNTSTSTFTFGTPMGAPGPTISPPPSAVAGTTVQIQSIAYWDNSTSVFDSSCSASDNSGIQLITIQATQPNGVTGTLQVVVTNPTYSTPPGPVVTVKTPVTTPVPGQPITFTATLVPGLSQVPTGFVSWNFTGTSGIPPQPCPSGSALTPTGVGNTAAATCTIPGLQVAAGSYQVDATYSGDTNYGPATGLGLVNVPQQVPTLTVTPAATNSVATEPLTFTASVTGPSAATQPTGMVSWSVTGPGIPPQPCPNSTLSLTAPPSTMCTIPGNQVSVGTYTATATYLGDINYPSPAPVSATANVYLLTLVSVALNNAPFNTLGKIQSGDSIIVTFSGLVSLGNFCSAWALDPNTMSENLGNGLITVVNGGKNKNDSMTISSASCTPNTGFGGLDLGASGFVKNGTATYSGSTIKWDATKFTLTITLGAQQLSSGATLGTVSSNPIYSAGFSVPNSPYTIVTNSQF